MESDFSRRLAAARAGDREALGDLLAPHLPGLHAFVRARLRGALAKRESAADVVQSMCGDVLEDIASFRSDDERSFRSWLFRAVAHKLSHKRDFHYAARRDPAREEGRALDTRVDDAALARTYADVATPLHAALAREEVERFERAFDALPESYRDVLAHVSLAGLSYREAGELLGKSEDSVRQALHRARARLATLLRRDRTAE